MGKKGKNSTGGYMLNDNAPPPWALLPAWMYNTPLYRSLYNQGWPLLGGFPGGGGFGGGGGNPNYNFYFGGSPPPFQGFNPLASYNPLGFSFSETRHQFPFVKKIKGSQGSLQPIASELAHFLEKSYHDEKDTSMKEIDKSQFPPIKYQPLSSTSSQKKYGILSNKDQDTRNQISGIFSVPPKNQGMLLSSKKYVEPIYFESSHFEK